MDQTFVSGLGNIYVNEVLFMSKIKPLRICNSLNENEIKNLILNIKKILTLSISKVVPRLEILKIHLVKVAVFNNFLKYMGKKIKIVLVFRVKGK